MKTINDVYWEIGIPCIHCKYLYSKNCSTTCVNTTLNYMYIIAEEMVLRGEY